MAINSLGDWYTYKICIIARFFYQKYRPFDLFNCCSINRIFFFSGAGRMCDGAIQDIQVQKFCGDILGTMTGVAGQMENAVVCGKRICVLKDVWKQKKGPGRPFCNIRASQSVDRQTISSSEMSIDGFRGPIQLWKGQSLDLYCIELYLGSLHIVNTIELHKIRQIARLWHWESWVQPKICRFLYFKRSSPADHSTISKFVALSSDWNIRQIKKIVKKKSLMVIWSVSGWCQDGNTSSRTITEVKHLELNQFSVG